MFDYLNIHAEQIVWIVVLFLSFFSVTVFIWAIYSRWRLNLKEEKKNEVREKLSELVIQYVSGDMKFATLQSELTSKMDYSILMQLSNELEKSLEGDEKRRLVRLLNLKPIRSFFTENFESGDVLDKAKACLYFSRQANIKSSLIPRILSFTSSNYPMLAYASAMAIVVHGSMDQVREAMHNLLTNEGVSNQALNDIFKKLQSQLGDKIESESELLMDLISDDRYSVFRKAQMIRTLGELNMYESGGFLLALFQSLDPKSGEPNLVTALIDVLADFGMDEILSDLHETYSNSGNRDVRESAAKALGRFRDPVSIPVLKWLMIDPDFYVRFYAARSLAKYEDVDLNELNLPGLNSEDYEELIGEIKSSKNLES